MENIRYKAVCRICGVYKVEYRQENAISEVQKGNYELPSSKPYKICENGKHDLIIFEVKSEKK